MHLTNHQEKPPHSNSGQAVRLAQTLYWIFVLLTVASVCIRGYLFEKDTINIFKLGQYGHFGMLMTDGSYRWIQERYAHVWQTQNTAALYAKQYMDGE